MQMWGRWHGHMGRLGFQTCFGEWNKYKCGFSGLLLFIHTAETPAAIAAAAAAAAAVAVAADSKQQATNQARANTS